jgi:hypothetical protein
LGNGRPCPDVARARLASPNAESKSDHRDSERFEATTRLISLSPKRASKRGEDFESCETVSITESAQCSLVQRLAQLLALNFSTPQYLNFYTTPVRLELGPVISGRGGNADSSRGEFGFRAGRSAESPRVCSGGKRENPCRL